MRPRLALKLGDKNLAFSLVFLFELRLVSVFCLLLCLMTCLISYLSVSSKELCFKKSVMWVYVYLHIDFLILTTITFIRCTKRGKG